MNFLSKVIKRVDILHFMNKIIVNFSAQNISFQNALLKNDHYSHTHTHTNPKLNVALI